MNQGGTKICKNTVGDGCGKELPATDEHFKRTSKGRLEPLCRTCWNKKYKPGAKTEGRKGRYSKRYCKGFIEFEKVTVRCYNSNDGCESTRTMEIEKGSNPGRWVCLACKESGTPSERRYAWEYKGSNLGELGSDLLEEIHKDRMHGTCDIYRPGDPEFDTIAAQCKPIREVENVGDRFSGTLTTMLGKI